MRFAAWILTCAATLVALLYIASVPFYAGSSIGSRLNWRMEHGRLRIDFRPAGWITQYFFIAINSEGLKFAPEWRFYSAGHWLVVVPLWIPLGPCVLGSAGLFVATRRRSAAGGCTHCGYDLNGLAAAKPGTKCPECGHAADPSTSQGARPSGAEG
jgi:hypothetical protein